MADIKEEFELLKRSLGGTEGDVTAARALAAIKEQFNAHYVQVRAPNRDLI